MNQPAQQMQPTPEQLKQHEEQQAQMAEIMRTADNVICTECNGKMFNKATAFKKISALNPINDSGKEQLIEYPAVYCMECKTELDLT